MNSVLDLSSKEMNGVEAMVRDLENNRHSSSSRVRLGNDITKSLVEKYRDLEGYGDSYPDTFELMYPKACKDATGADGIVIPINFILRLMSEYYSSSDHNSSKNLRRVADTYYPDRDWLLDFSIAGRKFMILDLKMIPMSDARERLERGSVPLDGSFDVDFLNDDDERPTFSADKNALPYKGAVLGEEIAYDSEESTYCILMSDEWAYVGQIFRAPHN